MARSSLLGRWLSQREAPAAAPAPVDEVGQAILARWRRGDPAAFTELFRVYRKLVFGILHHLMPRDPDLEDVVQTAFVEIFRSLDRFEGRSRLSSWIARVTLHVGYHHLRRRKSRPQDYRAEPFDFDIEDDSLAADPHAAAERADAARRIHAILETIAEKKRTVFILNDLQGLPQDEVAEVVGTNIATVRTRLFYARKEFWAKALADPALASFADGGLGVLAPPKEEGA
ncbi:MAG: sigma-70 family RNA polymerase sigma factor [Deltaproteobacteria bacterium]|nr:sigma-70 family RNA polymerase sigma factor [Deltaproteobacteria bacterium]